MDTATIIEAPAPWPLPSVFDLGRHLTELWARLDLHSGRSFKSVGTEATRLRAKADYKATNAEIDATEALILARPVANLADAAALSVVAFHVADCTIEADGLREADVEKLRTAIARLSVVLVETAGLPPKVLMGENVEYIARQGRCSNEPAPFREPSPNSPAGQAPCGVPPSNDEPLQRPILGRPKAHKKQYQGRGIPGPHNLAGAMRKKPLLRSESARIISRGAQLLLQAGSHRGPLPSRLRYSMLRYAHAIRRLDEAGGLGRRPKNEECLCRPFPIPLKRRRIGRVGPPKEPLFL